MSTDKLKIELDKLLTTNAKLENEISLSSEIVNMKLSNVNKKINELLINFIDVNELTISSIQIDNRGDSWVELYITLRYIGNRTDITLNLADSKWKLNFPIGVVHQDNKVDRIKIRILQRLYEFIHSDNVEQLKVLLDARYILLKMRSDIKNPLNTINRDIANVKNVMCMINKKSLEKLI